MTEQATAGRGRASVLAGGIFAQLLTIGVARFAFTPLLPVMLAETTLSPASGGLLGGAIYAGYLTTTLFLSVVKPVAIRWALFRAGVILAVLTTFSMAFAESQLLWAVSRFLAGASGAAGMLLATEFLLGWLRARGLSPDLGAHFAGLGLGISLSGVVAILAGGQGWAMQWLIFGAVAVVLAPGCWLLVPRPEAPRATGPARMPKGHETGGVAWFWIFGLAYLTAGWGYSVGATFYVAILGSNAFWILLGLACAAGALLGSASARRFGTPATLVGCYLSQIAALLLLALPVGELLHVGSAALFGGTFVAIVSLSLAEGAMRAADTGQAMARLTLLYGTGQVAGPLVTGAIKTVTGSYTPALLLSALLMGGGLILLRLARRYE